MQLRTWMILLVCAVGVTQSLPAQSRVDLAGDWDRYLGDQFYDSVKVPSSYRPVGTARLCRRFDLPAMAPNNRAILVFEGTAMDATARVNGKEVGRLGPWLGGEMDITASVKTGRNELEVEVSDLQVPLGPNAAWEGYGGIIRDVYIDVRPDPYVENARLNYNVDPDKQTAECTLDVFLRSTRSLQAEISVELRRGGAVALRTRQQINLTPGAPQATLKWTMDHVALWSPDTPNLYNMEVKLVSASGEHVFAQETGFRDLKIEGDDFVLNGRRLVLKGVDRHDLWKDQGLTLTAAQIEQDMRMIKSMGANIVRLCCYPSDRRDLEWAGRLGLFVSEEPGLCWITFKEAPRATVEVGMRNLEGEIRRDWNRPALFSVMFANESKPTVEVLREARTRTKALMPKLFISATSISGPDAKKMFDEGGFDFYSYHPYTYSMSQIERVTREFTGKPLVFTEWGGPTGRLPAMMDQTVELLTKLIREGRLAGTWFWEWADMPQMARRDISMDGHGILIEGVVTEDRVVRPEVFGRLATLFRADYEAEPPISRSPEIQPAPGLAASAASSFTPVSLQASAASAAQHEAWAHLQKAVADFWSTNGYTETQLAETGGRFFTWSAPRLHLGPIPFETPVVDGETRPLAVPAGTAVDVALGGAEADRLHVLGNVTVPDGYPLQGTVGQTVGRYVIRYGDGEQQTLPLRWGIELTRSNRLSVATRLNPVAVATLPAIQYAKDPIREDYQTLLLTIPVKHKRLAGFRAELQALNAPVSPSSIPNSTGSQFKSGECVLLLYAVTLERVPQR
jgi:hypothetical protein